MKISFDLDCTPEEARAFLGLPDVRGMQEAVLKKVEQKLTEGLDMSAPELLLRTFVPGSATGIEQIQKLFWSAVQAAQSGKKEEK
jgi:hypothetical protein